MNSLDLPFLSRCTGTLVVACIFSVVIPTAFANADATDIRAVASKTAISIAETFTVRVEATVQPGSTVSFTKFEPGSKLGDFDVLSTEVARDLPSTSSSDADRIWTQIISLETIKIGQQTIPSIEVSIRSGDSTQRYSTQPITIQVQSVLKADDQTVREIVGEIAPEESDESQQSRSNLLLPAIMLGISTIVLAAGWWRFRRKRTPIVWCKQELGNIADEQDRTNQVSRIRELLCTLVSIHRGSFTQSPSTRRLIDACEAIKVDLNYEHCQQILQLSDQAKFGLPDTAANPTDTQIDASIAEAGRLLEFIEESQR